MPTFLLQVIDLAAEPILPNYLKSSIQGPPKPVQRSHYCLSYTWGNPLQDGDQYSAAEARPIVLDGQIMRIRRNLFEALTALPQHDQA
jgi:hypothetical protein